MKYLCVGCCCWCNWPIERDAHICVVLPSLISSFFDLLFSLSQPLFVVRRHRCRQSASASMRVEITVWELNARILDTEQRALEARTHSQINRWSLAFFHFKFALPLSLFLFFYSPLSAAWLSLSLVNSIWNVIQTCCLILSHCSQPMAQSRVIVVSKQNKTAGVYFDSVQPRCSCGSNCKEKIYTKITIYRHLQLALSRFAWCWLCFYHTRN